MEEAGLLPSQDVIGKDVSVSEGDSDGKKRETMSEWGSDEHPILNELPSGSKFRT